LQADGTKCAGSIIPLTKFINLTIDFILIRLFAAVQKEKGQRMP
jgi:hypothetical protein